VTKRTDPISRYEDGLIAAVGPTIQAHTDKRLAEIRHAIMKLELRTSALASIIADMSGADADTTEAEERFAAALDELMKMRLDEGSLKFLMQVSEYK
jgi:hypothetical protein